MKSGKFLLILLVGILSACGGGSDSGGGNAKTGFTKNMSGTWSGKLDEVGFQMNISQADNAPNGAGVIFYDTGRSAAISLSKDGNDFTVVHPQFQEGCDGTFNGMLTSANTAEGIFELGVCGFSTPFMLERS